MSSIFRAFVSSTFEDLRDQRRLVINGLRNAGFFVDPMEDWSAAGDEPRNLSVKRVEGCDLCVLLVGFRRGHIPEGSALSVTQLEYEAARKWEIEVLVFMLDEQAAWPRKFDELDKDPEIRKWRKHLMEKTTVGFFHHDLNSLKIDSAITRWAIERFDRYRRRIEASEHLASLLASTLAKGSEAYQMLESADSLIETAQSLAMEAVI